MENYYKLLGVVPSANNEQIKKAYLKVLKKCHPDICKGDKKLAEAKTIDINIAYSTLTKSPESRIMYDKTIFPAAHTKKYHYDENGNQVYYAFGNNVTAEPQNQPKKFQTKKQVEKKKKQQQKSIKNSNLGLEEERRKKKQKLDTAIIIIGIVLVGIIGTIITLNILNK